jgi:CBS domain-containing protein/ribosome-associated translation inhibitor RaiA
MTVRVQEIMTKGVISIGPAETASTAWWRMQHEGIRHLVVIDDGTLVGVLSERDLGGRKGDATREGRTVGDLMTTQIATASPSTTLRQAANLMRSRRIGSLPVVEGERVLGIVTATDVLDELGRGSTRPAVRAERQTMRLPPAGARAATKRKNAGRRRARASKQARRSLGGPGPSDDRNIGDRSGVPSGRITPALGRERVRRPESSRRAPLADRIPRPAKRSAGRTRPAETPAFIRAVGLELDEADKDYLRRKLGRKLGKFAPSIERVSVRIEDVNGPRGGVDKRSRIKVVLSGMPSVLVEQRHHSLQAAMDGALARAEQAVRRNVQRRRATSVTTAGSSHRLVEAPGAPSGRV